MPDLRILHISDIHVSQSRVEDQTPILTSFLDDVEALHAARNIDLVIFTGDLAATGQEPEFALAVEVVLDPLVTRLGLPRARVVLAPGNHDVDRSGIDPYAEEGLQNLLKSTEAVNELGENVSARDHALMRIANFERFHSSYYGSEAPGTPDRLVHIHGYDIRGLSVGVAALNTAWRSSGDSDRGSLILGERQVTKAAEALKPFALRIVAFHHPLYWLAEFDEAPISVQMARNIHLLLNGHT